jgi:hypothetical protein
MSSLSRLRNYQYQYRYHGREGGRESLHRCGVEKEERRKTAARHEGAKGESQQVWQQ